MEKREYTFQDIYDYLKINYGVDWKLGKVYVEEEARGVLKFKFAGENQTFLTILAEVYKHGNKETVWIEVDNQKFVAKQIHPKIKEIKVKPETSWQDFYTKRHNSELTK